MRTQVIVSKPYLASYMCKCEVELCNTILLRYGDKKLFKQSIINNPLLVGHAKYRYIQMIVVSWCMGGSKGFAMVKLQYTTMVGSTMAGSYTMVAKGVNVR